ncbi:MAG TPA: 30S ribosomal protein S16 [Candidatus Sulfotelmatobacter sp.]|nr:30S ribosomal protein S16 [Candidatus Sulfotelmatobacter sp.]
MLVIRLQRTGRKGHAMFRLVVQDKRRSPTSGKVVALIGNYDPHSKVLNLDKEKVEHFLKNGAQPSPRAAILLSTNGIKLPEWVAKPDKKSGNTRNPDKRRSTRPDEPEAKEPKPEAEAPAEAKTEEAPKEVVKEEAVEETPKEEAADEPEVKEEESSEAAEQPEDSEAEPEKEPETQEPEK